METHSSIPAWKIPGTEKPGRLQPMRSQSWTHEQWAHTQGGLWSNCRELLNVNTWGYRNHQPLLLPTSLYVFGPASLSFFHPLSSYIILLKRTGRSGDAEDLNTLAPELRRHVTWKKIMNYLRHIWIYFPSLPPSFSFIVSSLSQTLYSLGIHNWRDITLKQKNIVSWKEWV